MGGERQIADGNARQKVFEYTYWGPAFTINEFKLLDQLDISRFIANGGVMLDVCFPALIKAIFLINPMWSQVELHSWTRGRKSDSRGTGIQITLRTTQLQLVTEKPGTPGEEQGLGIPEMAVGQWDSHATSPEGNHREKAINVSPKPQQLTVREVRGKRVITMILIDPEVMKCFQKCFAWTESQNDKVCVQILLSRQFLMRTINKRST